MKSRRTTSVGHILRYEGLRHTASEGAVEGADPGDDILIIQDSGYCNSTRLERLTRLPRKTRGNQSHDCQLKRGCFFDYYEYSEFDSCLIQRFDLCFKDKRIYISSTLCFNERFITLVIKSSLFRSARRTLTNAPHIRT